ncbi:hypothetical protein [Streptomyces sp. GC420]|uniref:hypothetical protein n=1 Tax=Streptomyces sp. GC420 TaxID=2697568 RepID=UPI001414F703|nr:hypothetical protein [Streptomyces sp. GC420]NBM16596.1 hypothetical protein [Streptomyces sp. GC420]
MTDDPSDEEILKSIGEHLGRSGKAAPHLAGTARITRIPVLDCGITRCVESRTEGPERRPGTFDLSGRPTYESLTEYGLDPPAEPRDRTLRLVKLGSVREESCGCGNGAHQCPRCSGRGHLPCEPATVCAECSGITPCTQYLKHGDSRGPRGRPPKANRKPARAEERVTCEGCGTPGSACARCRGWGRTACDTCGAAGRVKCPKCGGSGTEQCERCAGKGCLTFWTEGRVVWAATPESVPAPEPPWFVRSELEAAGAWKTAVLSIDDPLPDDLAASHRAVLEPRLVRRKDEVARRVRLRRLALARVELAGDRDRVFYVFPARTGRLEVAGRPSRRRVSRVAVAAAGCLTAVVLLVLLIR